MGLFDFITRFHDCLHCAMPFVAFRRVWQICVFCAFELTKCFHTGSNCNAFAVVLATAPPHHWSTQPPNHPPTLHHPILLQLIDNFLARVRLKFARFYPMPSSNDFFVRLICHRMPGWCQDVRMPGCWHSGWSRRCCFITQAICRAQSEHQIDEKMVRNAHSQLNHILL